MLARSLLFQKRYDEAVDLLQQALAIQERVYGKIHPRVASAVNDLASVALQRDKFDEAEAGFKRMAEIYRAVYPGKHYLLGIALANLGSVYLAQKENARAEPFFREALDVYAVTLPAGHLNVGITRIKLGRALLRQKRYAEAEEHILAGYEILTKQTSPSVTWLQAARKDLVSLYEALKQPEKARRFQAELAEVNSKTASMAAKK